MKPPPGGIEEFRQLASMIEQVNRARHGLPPPAVRVEQLRREMRALLAGTITCLCAILALTPLGWRVAAVVWLVFMLFWIVARAGQVDKELKKLLGQPQ
jgi:uncharacterized membrane protein YphA (DoxX/SURF4 family)